MTEWTSSSEAVAPPGAAATGSAHDGEIASERPASAQLLSEQSILLSRRFRLQWEPAQECHVLLYPEGMVKLNQSAGEILKRCDGQRTLDDVVRDLEAAFNAQGLTKDVVAFVEIAARQRWLQWD